MSIFWGILVVSYIEESSDNRHRYEKYQKYFSDCGRNLLYSNCHSNSFLAFLRNVRHILRNSSKTIGYAKGLFKKKYFNNQNKDTLRKIFTFRETHFTPTTPSDDASDVWMRWWLKDVKESLTGATLKSSTLHSLPCLMTMTYILSALFFWCPAKKVSLLRHPKIDFGM